MTMGSWAILLVSFGKDPEQSYVSASSTARLRRVCSRPALCRALKHQQTGTSELITGVFRVTWELHRLERQLQMYPDQGVALQAAALLQPIGPELQQAPDGWPEAAPPALQFLDCGRPGHRLPSPAEPEDRSVAGSLGSGLQPAPSSGAPAPSEDWQDPSEWMLVPHVPAGGVAQPL